MMFLGLDIGTSAVKAVLIDDAGAVAATSSVALTVQNPHPSWSEQNPDAWWQAVREACAKLSDSSGYATVAAIGLSGQMHGAVCLGADLTPLRPAILWNDGRSAAQCAEMLEAMPEIGHVAGAIPMPGFTAPKLLWLSQNEPEIHSQIKHVLLPKDYVRLKLTGTLVTDMVDGAGTHWLDQATRRWSEKLCEVSATDPAWLPECVEGIETSGHLTESAAESLGLLEGVPVAGGGGDAAAGAIGIGAVEDGDAFISLGTSGQLFVVTDSYRPNPESATHAYAHCVPDRWFQMAAMLNGASPIAWWANTVKAPIEEVLAEAKTADPKRVPLFLPYLTGERTPLNDADIRSSFYGMGSDTGRAEMTQAVLDAITYSFCDARDALAEGGSTINYPAVIGGGARSDHLLQTISDALGLPLKRYQDAETGPAFGAARLAKIANGSGTISEVITAPEIDREFAPNVAMAGHHAARLENYRALYQALKPFAKAL